MTSALQARAASALSQVTIFDALKAVGAQTASPGTHQIRCPIHDDRTPSARVYADENRVYCFTCGQRWDAIDLIRLKFHLTFEQAVEWLERRFTLKSVTENLPAVLRARLQMTPRPDPEPCFRAVESELIRARHQIGCERYGRLLLALDLAKCQCAAGAMAFGDYRGVTTQILQVVASANGEDLWAAQAVSAATSGLAGV